MNKGFMKEFFDYLNENCNYLVLRNWDDLLDEDMYGTGHEDIDILCDDLESFLHTTGAVRIHKENYRDNFIVPIGEDKVRLDIRWIGDGYYPTEWERKMLERRTLNQQGIFILCSEDYFYSLAYHALLQKPQLSSEYLTKLNTAYYLLNHTHAALSAKDILLILNSFLLDNDYVIEITNDPGVYINKKITCRLPRRVNGKRNLRRFCFEMKNRVVYYINRLKSKLRK